eukprot:4574296-Amphidinium_carterae.1
MQMLVHALHVEAPDSQSEHWEEALTASGACNAFGVVDVKRFVAFCLQGDAEAGVVDVKHFGRAGKVLGVLSSLHQQEEEERVAAPSEPSNEMLAATNPSNPSGRDTGWSSPAGMDMDASSWT